MAVSKASKAGNNKPLAKKRDQVFDIVDAVQNGRRREALTQLKELLDPTNDTETQNHVAKCSLGVAGVTSPGESANTDLQNCWRLPFRGFSHQVYAILREEFALTGSFDSVLGRLNVCLSEHPKQARKLADERKILRSKGTNDMRAWTKSSDDLLQQSFAKRAEVAASKNELTGPLEETTVIATPAPSSPRVGDGSLGSTNSDFINHDSVNATETEDGAIPLHGTDNQDIVVSQDTVYLQDTLADDADDREPLYQNTNRQTFAPTSSDFSRLGPDASERSALSNWKRGAGRKKSWKFCPTQRLPTRRKHKGFREPILEAEEFCPADLALDTDEPSSPAYSPSTGDSTAPDSATGVKPARYARIDQQAHECRVALHSKRSGRKDSVWTWNRSLSLLSDDPDDLMPTGCCPLVHRYPRERKSTKVVIQRADTNKSHDSLRTTKRSPALPKPTIVKTRLLSFSSQEAPRSHLKQEASFAKEKTSFESLLLSIPENLPGWSAKKQKRRGINKLKVPEFSNSEQLFSFLQTSWENLLERMTGMKDSLSQEWKGTQESYSRKRRTFQAWKKQLEYLEPVLPLAQKLEARYRRADILIRKEMQKLETYATWVEHSQSAIVDLSWTMRKQSLDTKTAWTMAGGGGGGGPLLDLSDYSELLRHGFIRYSDDFVFGFRHWAVQGISVLVRVTKAHRDWCQMSENLVKSLLNSHQAVAA
ncbi:hypothetical protein PFICI_11679 [Pestalotiopsis fici W106-1]|uniref:Uncharacterized protein n=1 Tax=Pestalotiopsis fici (strain W106-1 / CGMCC3.15140) TaxID=1229662 RepID=W3WT35_PESFW|nr:uncharacterized protein PFICI_11679 [Pestalotiopsis fici W106-1]ETS76292.1 hypothetical protein PFICI_11679 [Pestalotiopsis fici W106-1]